MELSLGLILEDVEDSACSRREWSLISAFGVWSCCKRILCTANPQEQMLAPRLLRWKIALALQPRKPWSLVTASIAAPLQTWDHGRVLDVNDSLLFLLERAMLIL